MKKLLLGCGAVVLGLIGAGAASSAATVPAAVSASSSLTPGVDGCDWLLAYGPGSQHNFAFPDADAVYYQASPPVLPAAGSRLKISGLYVNARYFSLQLYDGNYQPIDGLSDAQLVPDAGSQSTIAGLTTIDASVPTDVNHYTAYIEFAPKPANPEPNTLYAGSSGFSFAGFTINLPKTLYLLYRVYLPKDSTQTLPQLGMVAAGGGSQPLPPSGNAPACNNTASLALQQALASINTLDGTFAGLYSQAPQNPPKFEVYYSTPAGIIPTAVGASTSSSSASVASTAVANASEVNNNSAVSPLWHHGGSSSSGGSFCGSSGGHGSTSSGGGSSSGSSGGGSSSGIGGGSSSGIGGGSSSGIGGGSSSGVGSSSSGGSSGGSSSGGGFTLNVNASYMSATSSRSLGSLFLVRGRAPTHTGQSLAGGVTPDVRFWSFCQNSAVSTSVSACVSDANGVLDTSGFYNIVVSDGSSAPAGADAAHGFNWLPYSPQDPSLLIYRQILPSADYLPHSISSVARGTAPDAVMGDEAPVATYCLPAVFAHYTAAGESPATVFAACQAGK
ncbi:MAG: hypothetical protein P4L83_19025 [Nevskia sp.]|nr:hypothetical protein [Nevskia sp.]